MNKLQRLIAIFLLSLTLAVTVLPAPLLAEDEGCSNCHHPDPGPTPEEEPGGED